MLLPINNMLLCRDYILLYRLGTAPVNQPDNPAVFMSGIRPDAGYPVLKKARNLAKFKAGSFLTRGQKHVYR